MWKPIGGGPLLRAPAEGEAPGPPRGLAPLVWKTPPHVSAWGSLVALSPNSACTVFLLVFQKKFALRSFLG
eukprot:6394732-Pyramimonas_sp.AAC.1